jgi:hypothetical protein
VAPKLHKNLELYISVTSNMVSMTIIIEVHTSSTLGDILNSREATKKIEKWAIELSMYDIVYKPRIAIKAQALSDFVA